MAKDRGKYMNSTDGLFAGAAQYRNQFFGEEEETNDGVVYVNIEDLCEFHRHPFKVVVDETMYRLSESIKEYGIQEPLLIRPSMQEDGKYEIISGHRRRQAAILAGLTEVPVRIKELDDDVATILMVDSNNKREILLPSEKAWAYRLKQEALSHQGKRTDLTGKAVETTANTIGQAAGESARTVQRYIRLTYLKQELLELCDQGKLSLGVAIIVSYFSKEEQSMILNAYIEYKKFPSQAQMKQISSLHQKGELTKESLKDVLNIEKETTTVLKFNGHSFGKYFAQGTTKEEMEEVILELLEEWSKERGEKSYE